MTHPYQPHVVDVGVSVRLRVMELPPGVTDPLLAVHVDLSDATGMHFIFLSPKKRRFVVDAAFVTDGSDGRLEYFTTVDTFDVPGHWRVQAGFTLGPTVLSTDILVFLVSPNL